MRENAQKKCKSKQNTERKPRSYYTDYQVGILEREFSRTHHPNIYAKERIAKEINVDGKCVQVKTISRYHVDCFNEQYTVNLCYVHVFVNINVLLLNALI